MELIAIVATMRHNTISVLKNRPMVRRYRFHWTDARANEWGKMQYGGSDLFNSHAKRLAERHGHKVWRLGIDAGFGCPHRQGGRGKGGCSFCSADAGLAVYQRTTEPLDVREQIRRAMLFTIKRYRAHAFFLYFQAYSCTNLPVDLLSPVYDGAIKHFHELAAAVRDELIANGGLSPEEAEKSSFQLDGMVVSTRPDCFDEAKAALLASYANEDFEVWVEFGLQSAHDETLKRIHRGHSSADYVKAIEEAGRYSSGGVFPSAMIPGKLRRAVHLILGLPGEGREMMMETVRFVAAHGVEGVKFHDLRLAKGSAMERSFQAGEFFPLHPSRLPGLIADCLELFPENVEVIRLCSDFARGETLDVFDPPDKNKLHEAVSDELARRGSHQGARFSS
jgi:radical SAM protein (TIGR01212 family)